MLLAFWSPKGGSGTSVLAAACVLVLARHGGARLADLDGDQPAIFGLDADPPTGLADWLAVGPEAPTDALERLAVEARPGVALLGRGSPQGSLAPVAAAEAGAALGVALRDGPHTVLDLGTAVAPAARALLEVSDAAVVVLRGCYLALRRAVHAPGLARTSGVAVVHEQGRTLRDDEIADVLDRPVVARVPTKVAIARAVDAGVLSRRLPDALARPAGDLLARLGLLPVGRGRMGGEAA
jgi:MinD-like ATPase involved in chromosome partitioning or flagellar assembly